MRAMQGLAGKRRRQDDVYEDGAKERRACSGFTIR